MYSTELYLELVRSEWHQQLFFSGMQEKQIKLTDKTVKDLLNNYNDRYKEIDPIPFIIKHLENCPSEKRFNIFHNHFNFSNYSNEDKAKIISVCFIEGRPKLLKRSMELLFNDDIANILPNELLNISTHNFQKNSLVHNSRILKNFYSIPEQLLEIQNKIAIIIKSHRNINSLFTQDFNFSEDQKDKIQKQFHYYMVMGTHSKIEFNDNFKQFYSENRTVDLDYQYIKSFLSTSRRNPEPFLNFMKNQGYFDNIFDDIHKIKNVESALFKYHDGCNEGEEFKINRFFTFAKYLKEDLFIETFKSNIFDHYKSGPSFEAKIFAQSFFKAINQRLISSEIKDDRKDGDNKLDVNHILAQYKILKEKEMIFSEIIHDKKEISKALKNPHKKTLKQRL